MMQGALNSNPIFNIIQATNIYIFLDISVNICFESEKTVFAVGLHFTFELRGLSI